AEAPEARRQVSDRTGSKPGVALVRALTAKQAFDNIPDCRVVGAGVRQYICRGDVAKQVLRPRRCTAGQQKPSALQIGQALQFVEQVGFSLEAASGVSVDEVGVTDDAEIATNPRRAGGKSPHQTSGPRVRFDAGTSLDLAGGNAMPHVPGDADTLHALTDPQRRPAQPLRTVGSDVTQFRPPAEVELSTRQVGEALRTFERGSAAGLSGASVEL
ncbi:unnamed protein product, partial [Symbiodinium microadriaticum]